MTSKHQHIATKSFLLLFTLLALLYTGPANHAAAQAPPTTLPEGFVYVTDIAPDIILEIRYHGHNNFVGAPVDGYEAPVAILSLEAAAALKGVSDTCRDMGYAIKIFDAYRPQSAVNHFVRWVKEPETDLTKTAFYPNIAKDQLFKSGYLATKSGHSRGGTVDLTLVDLATGLDMGTPFDFLDPRSHFNARNIASEQIYNRSLLRAVMKAHGFRPYDKEWWHFTLNNEPFPKTYFDFPVR